MARTFADGKTLINSTDVIGPLLSGAAKITVWAHLKTGTRDTGGSPAKIAALAKNMSQHHLLMAA